MRLQQALNDLEKWCSTWRIKLNVAKTQLVCFTKSKAKVPPLKLFGQPVPEQDELTLLGATFGKYGSLATHCRAKASKANARVAMLRSLSGQQWGSSSKTLLGFYKQFVRPVLETGSVCSAVADKTHIASLQRVQNSALRVALRRSRDTRITELHLDAGIDPIADRLTQLREKAVKRFGQSELMQNLELLQSLLLQREAAAS